ncbi:immunoglobulin domain-containing protein [Bernardetia sp. MNP-M8]|uniref:immunoglobulin domain-containing protein n=1 Tax=Bernardetia sp. MNP-M8 TaxID=3127470 RepID=UPI0030CED4E1
MKQLTLLFLLPLFFLLGFFSTATAYVDPDDYRALVALYNATNGDSWTNNTGWNVTQDPNTNTVDNSWYGITVSGDRVTKILLPNNNLNNLTDLYFNIGLEELGEIDLSNNNLKQGFYFNINRGLNKVDLSSNSISKFVTGSSFAAEMLNISNSQATNFEIFVESQSLFSVGTIDINNSQATNFEIFVESQTYFQVGTIDISNSQTTNFEIFVESQSLFSVGTLDISNNQVIDFSIDGDYFDIDNLYLNDNNITELVLDNLDGVEKKINNLYLDNNKLEDIVVSNPLQDLSIKNNYLQFGILEKIKDGMQSPFVGNPSYIPQNKYPTQDVQGTLGQSIQLDGTVTGTPAENTYKWYKSGSTIEIPNPNTNKAILTIDNTTTADEGTYYCKVTNGIVTGLVLTSEDIEVTLSEEEDCKVHLSEWTGMSYMGYDSESGELFGTQPNGSTWAWTSSATSLETLDGNGTLEFSVSAPYTNRQYMVGFRDTPTGAYRDLDYGFQQAGNALYIRENNVIVGQYSTESSTMNLRIERVNGVVSYYKNGILLYTSPTLNTAPLYVTAHTRDASRRIPRLYLNTCDTKVFVSQADCFGNGSINIVGYSSGTYSIKDASGTPVGGGDITNTMMSLPFPIGVYTVEVTTLTGELFSYRVSIESASSIRFGGMSYMGYDSESGELFGTQPNGSTWAWTSSATSLETLDGNGSLEFSVSAPYTNRQYMVGFRDTPTGAYRDLDYGFQQAGNALYIRENNVIVGQYSTESSTMNLRIERVNGVVSYYKNGILLYTSPTLNTAPLYVTAHTRDASRRIPRLYLNTCDTKVFVSQADCFGNGSINIVGYSSGTYSIKDASGTPVGGGDITNTMMSLPFPIGVYTVEVTTLTGELFSYRVSIESASSIRFGGMSYMGYDSESGELFGTQPNGSTWAWTSSATSLETLDGNGSLEFSVSAPYTNRQYMVGFRDTPTGSYRYLDYGFQQAGNVLYVRENNVVVARYLIGSSTNLRIERVNGVISYYKDGILLYVSPTVNTSSLYVAAHTLDASRRIPRLYLNECLNKVSATQADCLGNGSIDIIGYALSDYSIKNSSNNVVGGGEILSNNLSLPFPVGVYTVEVITSTGNLFSYRVSIESASSIRFGSMIYMGYDSETGELFDTQPNGDPWKSEATSLETLDGNGSLEFSVSAPYTNRQYMVGFRDTPTGSYRYLDYGFQQAGNVLYIRENNVVLPLNFTIESSIINLRIERVNGVISYYKNGILLYTSPTLSTASLYVAAHTRDASRRIPRLYLDRCLSEVSVVVNNSDCSSDNTGSIILSSSETGDYSYEVLETSQVGSFTTSITLSNLASGQYTIIISKDGVSREFIRYINPNSVIFDNTLSTYSYQTNQLANSSGGGWNTGGYSSSSFLEANENGYLEIDITDIRSSTYYMLGFSDDPTAHYGSIDYAFYYRLNELQIYESGNPRVFSPSIQIEQGSKLRIKRKGNVIEYIYINPQGQERVVRTVQNAITSKLSVTADLFGASSKTHPAYLNMCLNEVEVVVNNSDCSSNNTGSIILSSSGTGDYSYEVLETSQVGSFTTSITLPNLVSGQYTIIISKDGISRKFIRYVNPNSVVFTLSAYSYQSNQLANSSGGNTWGTGGYSNSSFLEANENGYLEIDITDIRSSTYYMLGFSDDPTAHYGSIDYAFYYRLNELQIYESGNPRVFSPSIQIEQGSKLRIKRKGNVIEYIYINPQGQERVVRTVQNAITSKLSVTADLFGASSKTHPAYLNMCDKSINVAFCSNEVSLSIDPRDDYTYTYTLYNSSGQEVSTGSGITYEEDYLPNGIYVLIIKGTNGTPEEDYTITYDVEVNAIELLSLATPPRVISGESFDIRGVLGIERDLTDYDVEWFVNDQLIDNSNTDYEISSDYLTLRVLDFQETATYRLKITSPQGCEVMLEKTITLRNGDCNPETPIAVFGLDLSKNYSFLELNKNLSASYYSTNDEGLLNFKYTERYKEGDLDIHIYNWERCEVGTVELTKKIGSNWYSLDLNEVCSENEYYVMEVFDENNRRKVLNFKYGFGAMKANLAGNSLYCPDETLIYKVSIEGGHADYVVELWGKEDGATDWTLLDVQSSSEQQVEFPIDFTGMQGNATLKAVVIDDWGNEVDTTDDVFNIGQSDDCSENERLEPPVASKKGYKINVRFSIRNLLPKIQNIFKTR